MNRGIGNWYKSIHLIKIAKENFPILKINRLISERSSSTAGEVIVCTVCDIVRVLKKCVCIKERKIT